MKVGIDFGTTYTVAAVVDRGNYPVASCEGVDAWPSVIAANAAGELRLLNDAGPKTEVDLGGRSYALADLLTGFLAQLKSDLHHHSNACLASRSSRF